MTRAKTNYHTHTTWCDGRDTPAAMAAAAAAAGFEELGFSSHALLPGNPLDWALDARRGAEYARDIRALAAKYEGRLKILCGIEADYLPGAAEPSRAAYAPIGPDYIIGSVHFVRAPDGAAVCVDKSPEDLAEGLELHFNGDAEAALRAYFAQIREMARRFDFDVFGHLDLPRKFNAKHPYFDESAPWYLGELEATADAVAKTGRLVEVNTGGIARGWLDDAYPSPVFRAMLRERGARFILSSDAHSAEAIDCAFDRFVEEEKFERLHP